MPIQSCPEVAPELVATQVGLISKALVEEPLNHAYIHAQPIEHGLMPQVLQPGAAALGPRRPHARGRTQAVRGRPAAQPRPAPPVARYHRDRKSPRLNSTH